MIWTERKPLRRLSVVEAHCEGEVGRVIVDGAGTIPGRTMAQKLSWLNGRDDSIRRLVMREPRGFAASHAVLLTEPTVPEADAGLLILATDKTHAMSGSNVMCAATVLLETGRLPMTEPETTVVFDTVAGPVRARAACNGGKCTRVTLQMPPAFALALDAEVETAEWGRVRFDVGFGGVFCAIVPIDQFGLEISPGAARALSDLGVALHERIARAHEASHPDTPELSGLAYVMFRAEEPDGATRTCSVLLPGRIDRSPCGTGSIANLAVRRARGLIGVGESCVTRSATGGRFSAKLLSSRRCEAREVITAEITGRCWIHGYSELVLDPDDPFPSGFLLSDTWGPMAGRFGAGE